MPTQLGFNNFKAFGSHMQYFTKKPITLVYGPNSVGKSSFLHSQLYLDYLRKTNMPNLDLDDSFFAGDKLDLGGFDNFIHKHNKTNAITYVLNISDRKNLDKLLLLDQENISQLIRNNFQNMDLSNSNLEKILNQEIKFGIKAKDVISFIQTEEKLNLLSKYSTNQDLKDSIELTNKSIRLQCKVAAAHNDKELKYKFQSENIENVINKGKLILEECKSEILNKKDLFIENIILTGKSDINKIKYYFDFLKYLLNIKSITLKIELGRSQNKFKSFLSYFIDDEILFDAKKLSINKNHNFMNNLDKLIKFDYDSSENLFNNCSNSFNFFDMKIPKDVPLTMTKLYLEALNFINFGDIEKNIQYFGPLRFYPERIDLFFKNSYKKHNTEKKKNNQLLNFNNYNSIFNKKPLIFLRPSFWKMVFKSQTFLDSLNKFFNLKNKKSQFESNNSQQMWEKLVQSEDIIKKLNNWLSNEKKLKSNYQISIDNVDKYKYLVFTDIKKQTEVTPRDMGLGISQMLPILISTISSKNTKIYVEQPELHLHPAVQMELMDEFIKSYNKNNNEFLLESHSEHMLLRVMKRIRQTNEGTLEDSSLRLTPDDICLLYVDNDGEQTYIQELRLSKTGKLLDHWPNGFFEEGYKERFF